MRTTDWSYLRPRTSKARKAYSPRSESFIRANLHLFGSDFNHLDHAVCWYCGTYYVNIIISIDTLEITGILIVKRENRTGAKKRPNTSLEDRGQGKT